MALCHTRYRTHIWSTPLQVVETKTKRSKKERRNVIKHTFEEGQDWSRIEQNYAWLAVKPLVPPEQSRQMWGCSTRNVDAMNKEVEEPMPEFMQDRPLSIERWASFAHNPYLRRRLKKIVL